MRPSIRPRGSRTPGRMGRDRAPSDCTMTSFFGRVHSGLTEGLILGTLLFGLMAFGAVDPWAIIIIHWATLALIGLTAIRWLYQRDVRFPGGWLNLPISLLVLAVLLSTPGSIYRYGSVQEAARIINYVAFFYLVFLNHVTQRAVIRF